MERKLQVLTTIAFLLLCVVGTALGVRVLLQNPVVVAGGTDTRIPPPTPPAVYGVGERISIRNVDFARTPQTALLVLRKDCRFCDESMPFYKRLSDDPEVRRRTRIIVLAPDDEMVSRDELLKHGIRVDQVVRVGLDELKVRGTPTAVVVDEAGVVQRLMTGRLDATQQEELLGALRGKVRD